MHGTVFPVLLHFHQIVISHGVARACVEVGRTNAGSYSGGQTLAECTEEATAQQTVKGWLFSRKKSEHHAFIYPREHTRTNILDHHLYLCKLGKGKRGLTACGRLVGRLSGGQVVPLCSPVTSWGLIGATNDVKEKERIVPYFFSYL